MTLPKQIIFVTGTNGKTATAITLSHIFREHGLTVVNNNEGSNLNSGIISKFLKHSSLFGRIKADAAVLEVDEDATANLAKKIHPQYIVMTSLYRDSISRNAHADFVYEKLTKIPEGITLVLNADDMISGSLGEGNNPTIYYGAEQAPGKTDVCENIICDIKACPKCAMPIKYDYIQFHHIGRAHCAYCGFTMPEPDIYADQINETVTSFRLTDRIRNEELAFPNRSGNLFEIYNTLAIVGVCRDLGYTLPKIREALANIKDVGGRYQDITVNDTQIISMVSKSQNPISCSQSFSKARQIKGNKVIILAVNDREYGGKSHHEDTSWFYDTDFEFLVEEDVLQYILVGPRAYDVALRLVLAGADEHKFSFSFEYATDIVKMIDYPAVKGGAILFFFEVYFREWSKKMKHALYTEGKKHEQD